MVSSSPPAAPDILHLYPGGYPLTIDVAEASMGGLATAMHFSLPPHGHNFPLFHLHEHKLITALAGEVRLRAGAQTLALLSPGQAVLVPPGTVHRIAQAGEAACTVGIVLWPGAVEHAFRQMAEQVAQQGFQRPAMIALLARFDVQWRDAPLPQQPATPLAVGQLEALMDAVPAAAAQAVAQAWAPWRQSAGNGPLPDPARSVLTGV